MSKISIKIVEVEQATHTVMVKYASEFSKKSIDEYPAVAFQVTNFDVKTVDEFITAIRPQVSLYVWQRDQTETPKDPIDLSGWDGYSIDIEAYTMAEAALDSQQPAVQVSPEVTV
jgi:hypothetical protein